MNTSLYINFGTAAVTFIFGLLMISGVLFPGRLDSTMTMFSVILMVYGVYRFVTTVYRMKQLKLEERRRLINEEKEKLIDRS